MNIQEYIESGIIELYVTNALTEAERAEVEVMARQYPEIQSEIEDVQSVMQLYAQAHAITPSADLKDKILEKIKAPTDVPQATSTPQQLATATTSVSSLKGLGLVPWIIAGALGLSTVYFYSQYKSALKTQQECEDTQKTNDLKNKKAIAEIQERLDIIKNPSTKEVVLNGMPIAPSSKVIVFWNAEKKATYLTIQNLPPPPSDKQYQFWAIVDKKPVNAGMLEYGSSDLQLMKGFETAEAFAITLEPQGGSDSPTLDKMYVLGTL